MFRSDSLMYPRSIRIRPSAPPLLFWKVSASTTCSRVTLAILVSTRPIGRPCSWSIGGMALIVEVGAAGAGVPPAGSAPGERAAALPPAPAGFGALDAPGAPVGLAPG